MKKPAIRFKGFTEDWEQRKLGDCFTERVESMPEGELISVTINDGIKKFSELGRHDNSNDDKSKYKKVCIGDIAYNSMRMWQGASGYSPYEGIVSPAYTVLSPNLGINSKCLAYQFKMPEMIHTFQVNSQGITSDNWNLKYPAFSQIEIFVSKYEREQAQIAEYFENLDNLITLHQRKYEKLQNMKKACLEKMFPKNGSNVPEIRFKGFTEAWEQRKVSDIAPLQRGFDLSTTNMKAGKYPVVMSNGIGGYHSKYKAKGPGVVTGRSGTIGRLHYIKDDYWPHNTALWVTSFKGNHPKFVYYLYQQLGLERFGSGSGVPTLNRNDVHDAIVPVPHAEEQAQIAACFSQLDHLITLHQRELEKLQNIKKSMLEKMFVSEKKEK